MDSPSSKREPETLRLLYRDAHYVAIDKPPGLMVHRSRLSSDDQFVLQRLRGQIRQRVYPVHRLDRATSGVLVFGLDLRAATLLSSLSERRAVEKRYLAVVRGYVEEAGIIGYPIRDEERGTEVSARTRYRRLATVEIDAPLGRYATNRYSLVEVSPETGRRHQIRRHFKHIFHPLIGDTTYGEGRHNRLFRDRFGVRRLMLMALSLGFSHPITGESVAIEAGPDDDWLRVARALGWELTVGRDF